MLPVGTGRPYGPGDTGSEEGGVWCVSAWEDQGSPQVESWESPLVWALLKVSWPGEESRPAQVGEGAG